MQPKQLVETALALDDANAQRSFLLRASLSDSALVLPIAEQIKRQFDAAVHQSIQRAEQLNDLLAWYADVHIDHALVRALSLRAAGSLVFFQGSGSFQTAIAQYDAAADIYLAHNKPEEAANSQIGKIVCLGYLGEAEKALALGSELQAQFEAWGKWDKAFQVIINTQLLLYRLGRAQESLAQLDVARQVAVDFDLPHFLPMIELNRASTLRDLGWLDEAEATTLEAERLSIENDYGANAVHARYNRAIIYFLQNRYNEALALFDQVREEYLRDRRVGDLHWVNLAVTNCLLQLGRFQEVLTLCETLAAEFAEIGATNEIANVQISAANAHAGLGNYHAAVAAFDAAQKLFEASDDEVWGAICAVERAAVLCRMGAAAQALESAAASGGVFKKHQLNLRIAQSELVVAKGSLLLGDLDRAQRLAERLVGGDASAWVRFEASVLLGDVAVARDDSVAALHAYESAIGLLEELRGHLITEYRADFVADKQRVYEAVVGLLLAQNRPKSALQYVERAKSRALTDLIAYNLDLRIEPRAEDDRHQVEALADLQQRRNVLYRRWMSGDDDNLDTLQQRLNDLENDITRAWHKLLIQNADYARDASLTTIRTEPIQPHLDANTLLLEFFQIEQELIVFLISRSDVDVVRLPNAWRRVAQLSRQLNLNFKAVSTGRPNPNLLPHAQHLLKQLYDCIIAPLGNRLARFERLIIVPHGAALHYLPFQALYDGTRYLCERLAISYLPSARLLHYAGRPAGKAKTVAFGFSNAGALPFAVQEAAWVAEQMDGVAFVEEAATLGQIEVSAENAAILHFSTHGDFNQHNPLFSGLSFADGQLNTLDIFNLRLNASLVTLSACQTGRNVIKGGDEIMGLTRAFLYAGAESLLLSLWRVADSSTLVWMQHFYSALNSSATKGEALQQTQAHFIHHETVFRHPYYWAPFFLVGRQSGAVTERPTTP